MLAGGASGTAQRVGEGGTCTAFGVIQYILRKLQPTILRSG